MEFFKRVLEFVLVSLLLCLSALIVFFAGACMVIISPLIALFVVHDSNEIEEAEFTE